MRDTATTDDKPSMPAELWERKDVLAYFGGTRPLHTSTLYRGIHDGLYPRPIRVSRTHVRWIRSECEAALDRMIAARDEPRQQTMPRRGRPRRSLVGADTLRPEKQTTKPATTLAGRSNRLR